MAFLKKFFPLVFAVCCCCICNNAAAQENNDTTSPAQDSTHIKTVKEKLVQRFKDSVTYESDTIVSVLVKKIQEVTELLNTTNRLTEKNFDTIAISKALPVTEQLLSIIESEFISRNSFQNLRALKTAKSILTQSETQLESWQNILFHYTDEFANIKVKLAKERKDSTFRKIPEDSLLRNMYFEQVAKLLVRWKKADSVVNINMLQIGLLQNRVSSAFLKTKDYLDKTDYKLKKNIKDLWLPEEPSMFTASGSDYDVSLGEAYRSSLVTMVSLIVYYFEINTNLWIASLIITLSLYAWILRTVFKLKKEKLFSAELKTNSKLITRFPVLSATGLVLSLIAIFFFNLPPSLNSLVWIILAIAYFILSRFNSITRKAYRPEFLVIFLIFISLSILLKNSFAERWVQCLMDLVNIGYGIFMLRQLKKTETADTTYAKATFFIFVVLSAGALITNSYGSFMLAKTLNNGAVYAIVTAVVFYLTAEMIILFIHLQQEAFKGNRFVSYFDLHNLQITLGKLLRIAAFAAWLMIIAQQLNFFDYAYEWVYSFLTNERKLGGNSFTFGSIFVFIIVIWFSSFLSQMIMILFGHGQVSTAKKSRWGSMLILIRLAILSAGIIIAFVASGIPMDKLTIIIGALGVGIGFGLQNIVNNLVSGVILAFEKPVQIGDAIEVGNRYGTVKEIGIRSSKILTVEGSEVIVPNGDMLSQHIVNWTLSSNYRRVEIIIGVAYNSDLRLAEKILQDIISGQKGVESNPNPQVLVHQFADSAINFRLLFWCHIDTWVNVKSEMLMKIHQIFSENGIEIPFPQRVINIKGAGKLFSADEKNDDEKSKT